MDRSNLASSQNSSHAALHSMSIDVDCILSILPEEGTLIAAIMRLAIMRPTGAI